MNLNPHFPSRWTGPLAAFLAVTALSVAVLLACGPDFPNMLLTLGDRAILTAPSANFARELQRMDLPPSRFRYQPPPPSGDASQAAELADLRTALERSKLPVDEITLVLERHTVERLKLGDASREIKVATGLPPEFADYFRGSIWWHRGDQSSEPEERQAAFAKAAESWRTLLERPEGERPFKSTWAAYMLGVAERSLTNGQPEKAIASFQQVRTLADGGFADPLGLAAASYGLEAQTCLAQLNLVRATELYLDQASTGDPTAVESLRITAAQALRPENAPELQKLARHPRGRDVVTAHLASRRAYQPENSEEEDNALRRWLDLLEEANATDLVLAEKIALAAYQHGEMDSAERWLARCSSESFAARWLRAKLHFYRGEMDKAAEMLSSLAREFPPAEADPQAGGDEEPVILGGPPSASVRRQLLGEAGVLRLARRDFVEALDALLRAGFWIDAAYVAERVLTLPELSSYVDAQWPGREPEAPASPATEENSNSPEVMRRDLRFLLGRRLARAHQEEKAGAYLPAVWREQLDDLRKRRAEGADRNKPANDRAQALFKASKILREHGLELYGTETAPDWQVFDGNFTGDLTAEERAEIFPGEFLQASNEEVARARQHAPDPDRRFHYRYLAAELAFEAARLLPDNNRQAAIILCTAGSWLKDRDPKAADRFYKTLVRRCRKTEIGREADKIRWFPRIDENGKILPRLVPPPAAPVPLPPEILEQFPLARCGKDLPASPA